MPTVGLPPLGRPRTGSESSVGSIGRQMLRHRAASIGVDGPLLDGSEVGLASPRSEAGELPSLDGDGLDELHGGVEGLRRRGRNGAPKGGFKLGFTEMPQRDPIDTRS